ncbi:low specificity L-threonine aldolase [Odoribacter sp. OttesenSCG-928-J03]|nr:low specificity L-threonine aldolase [Odoribacter sp. OttesenSCG-928-J03]
MSIRGFGSDNFSGVAPEVFRALEEANYGHQHSYGEDVYTEKAIHDFKRIFGSDIEVFFAYNGTGANIIGISAFCQSFNAVICAETAHINVDECGAIQKQAGCKLLTLPTFDGKLTVGLIQNHMHGFGDQHHSQPVMISLTQCTELGVVYTPEELKEICNFAHSNGLYVHMDGARIANAIAYLNCDPLDITVNAGIDVLSFGGTKNGMMFGEAVIFFNTSVCKNMPYIRKQAMQLHSKSRFIAAQFSAVLKDNLWLKLAGHANNMAQKLASEAKLIPGVKITQEVQGNEVFAIIPRDKISALQDKCFFYIWNESASEVRWVCSFDTTESDIVEFVNLLREELC